MTGTAPHPVLTKYYRRESDRQSFVTGLFDGTAKYYDWVCGVGSLGSGRYYRRWALAKSGLGPGMTLLDVATGTGLVAAAATRVLRGSGVVVGLDPSAGMLRQARRTLSIPLVQGTVEELPFTDGHFDFVSMGYALRHVADLGVAFKECSRVLKPGGRLLVLEISRPRSAVGRWLARLYIQKTVPLIARLRTRNPETDVLMEYFWETIAQCVSPDTILDVLSSSGFVDVERRVRGLLSEYIGMKPTR